MQAVRFPETPKERLVVDSVEGRISDAAAWMRSTRLQLNVDKADVIWCSSARRQHQIQRFHLLSVLSRCPARHLSPRPRYLH